MGRRGGSGHLGCGRIGLQTLHVGLIPAGDGVHSVISRNGPWPCTGSSPRARSRRCQSRPGCSCSSRGPPGRNRRRTGRQPEGRRTLARTPAITSTPSVRNRMERMRDLHCARTGETSGVSAPSRRPHDAPGFRTGCFRPHVYGGRSGWFGSIFPMTRPSISMLASRIMTQLRRTTVSAPQANLRTLQAESQRRGVPLAELLREAVAEKAAALRRDRRPRVGVARSSDGLGAAEIASEPVAEEPH